MNFIKNRLREVNQPAMPKGKMVSLLIILFENPKSARGRHPYLRKLFPFINPLGQKPAFGLRLVFVLRWKKCRKVFLQTWIFFLFNLFSRTRTKFEFAEPLLSNLKKSGFIFFFWSTSFLEPEKKSMFEESFFSNQISRTRFLEPDFSNQISRTRFLEPCFYKQQKLRLQNKWSSGSSIV